METRPHDLNVTFISEKITVVIHLLVLHKCFEMISFLNITTSYTLNEHGEDHFMYIQLRKIILKSNVMNLGSFWQLCNLPVCYYVLVITPD
jgi:hypothetical protein